MGVGLLAARVAQLARWKSREAGVFLLLLLLLPAWGQPKIMYLNPEAEMRLSKACRRLDLPLPVLRIGVGESNGRQFAMIRFLAKGASPAQCRRETVRLVRVAFATLPQLQQLDVTGDDRDDEQGQKKRPAVYFSASVRRSDLVGVPATATPGRQLAAMTEIQSDPALGGEPEAVGTVGTVEALLRGSFQEAFRRMPIRRQQRKSKRPD